MSTSSLDEVLRGRTGLSPVMVGRSAALQRLRGLIDSAEVAALDAPEVALVSGEPGIGKTRLLRELLERLPADVTVLGTQAQPGSLGRPFDVIGQLATPGTDPAAGAMATIEAAVAAGRTVLVVEDLHWADADSAHLIEHLAVRPWPQLVVIGTYRPTDLSPKAPGGELVLRLERQSSVEQIRLDRLDRAEVASMLGAIGGSAPSSAAVEAVFRRSGGIPFVVEELMRAVGSELCSDDLLAAQLPWSLDEAVRQQLAGLGAAERAVVDALAVFGEPASFDLLASMTGLGEAQLLDALTGLARAAVLVETTSDHFWFAHALVADTVAQQLLGRQRRRLHERALVALQALPDADHASLARHAAGAGHFEQVVPIARAGARRYLDQGASFQALRLASHALEEEPDDVELLRVATDAAWRLDFLGEALGYGRRWRALATDDVDRVDAQRYLTRLLHEQGADAERDRALDALVQMAETLPDGRARGRAFGAIAQIQMLARRGEQSVAWADRALAAAVANDDRWLFAQASVERASATLPGRTREAARDELVAAFEVARDVDDPVLACRALSNQLNMMVAHSAAADALRAELRTMTASAGFDKLGAPQIVYRDADAAFGRGDLRAFRNALAEGQQYGGDWTRERIQALSYACELALEEGRARDAAALLDQLLGPDGPQAGCDEEVAWLALRAAGQLGDGQMAEEAWRRVLAPPTLADMTFSLDIVLAIVDAALLAGIAPDRIRRELFDGPLAAHPLRGSFEQHAAGLLLAASGDHAGAVARLRASLAELDPSTDGTSELPRPVLASLRLTLASAQLACGDRAGTLATVRQIVDGDLVNWPGWRRDRAEALLRRLEGSSVRSEGELTAREREVAALIAEGLTNGQLAERLYISPKTAAVHVSNILMKLGLSGRAEVAAWAVRHGVVLQGS